MLLLKTVTNMGTSDLMAVMQDFFKKTLILLAVGICY